MFPDVPVFDGLRDHWADRATAWDMGKRPVPRHVSDARVLDPDTAIVADCETSCFRALVREYPDRGAAEEIAEAMYQRDLDSAAQPPVIEVTVTTPPEGMPRADLTRLVAEKVSEVTGPLPAQPAAPARRRKVLLATRRARERRRGLPAAPPPVPVSEDDVPTVPLPAGRDDPVTLVEVRLP